MASETLGIREFANLALFLLRFYLRHKDNIDDNLNETVVNALTDLVAAMDQIAELNDPGPA